MSNNLPSKIKHKFKLRNPKRQINTQCEDDLQLMSNNLLRLQQKLTEQYKDGSNEEIQFESEGESSEQNHNDSDFQHRQMQDHHSLENSQIYQYHKQQKQTTQLQNQSKQQKPFLNNQQLIKAQLHQKYQEYLSSNNLCTNYQEKINQLLDCEEEMMSIGNTIALFQMVYFFKEILTTEVLSEIQFNAFQSVIALESNEMESKSKVSANVDNEQKDLMKLCYSELIAISGIPSNEVIDYYLHSIIENPSTFEQSFNVLINMGVLGLSSLLKIVNEDFQSLSQKVLQKLSKTQVIISKIIVPQIYQDLISVASSTQEKNTALCLLAKIGEIAYSQELMEILLSLFKNNSVNKNLLISAIISTGKQKGEQILTNILQKSNINENISIFIIKCLSISSDVRKQMKLKIQICEYTIVDLLQMNNLFFYEGQIKAFPFEESHNNDTLFVNSRMLVSLIEKFTHETQNRNSLDEQTLFCATQCLKNFLLPQIISKEEKDDLPNLEIINIFLSIIERSKSSPKIKQATIQAFGHISLPSNPIEIIQNLVQCLFQSNPSILTTTCITLAKFDFIPSTKVVQRFRELLKHNLWKVRISACQAIGRLLRQPIDTVLETLIKCLKDGSINRELVCQTLLKIHPVCQQLLIEILKSSKDTKIQEIILCSFNQKKILLSDNLLKVLEAIFDFSKNQKKQIRYICLGVVNSLRKISIGEQIETNHFKPKNILTFYYNFLSDSCAQIRDLALKMILEFGNYAELILIQGMTKGRVSCKIECAKGLGLRGAQNFRALLLGMRDLNEKVRYQCCQSILRNFQIQEICKEYQEKQSQCISLIYNIKDLIQSNPLIDSSIKIFLSQLSERLSQNINKFQGFSELDQDMEMERQINEFRQSMRLREKVEETLSTNIDKEVLDNENLDPNVIINNQHQQTQLVNVKKSKSGLKRYYFKLNQTIGE